MSRPSSTAPPGWFAKSCCSLRSVALTCGCAATRLAASPASPDCSTGSSSLKRSSARAALAAPRSSSRSPPPVRTALPHGAIKQPRIQMRQSVMGRKLARDRALARSGRPIHSDDEVHQPLLKRSATVANDRRSWIWPATNPRYKPRPIMPLTSRPAMRHTPSRPARRRRLGRPWAQRQPGIRLGRHGSSADRTGGDGGVAGGLTGLPAHPRGV